MHHDLTKLARDMRVCLAAGQPFSLAMRMSEVSRLLQILDAEAAPSADHTTH